MTEMQSGLDALDWSFSTITFFTNLAVTRIAFSFRLDLEGKTGKWSLDDLGVTLNIPGSWKQLYQIQKEAPQKHYMEHTIIIENTFVENTSSS